MQERLPFLVERVLQERFPFLVEKILQRRFPFLQKRSLSIVFLPHGRLVHVVPLNSDCIFPV